MTDGVRRAGTRGGRAVVVLALEPVSELLKTIEVTEGVAPAR